VSTGINDPVRNDVHFISKIYPALASKQINYFIGNMFSVQKLVITIYTINGQVAGKKEAAYENGTIDVSNYAGGIYVLTITSSDNKQQFIQRFIKN